MSIEENEDQAGKEPFEKAKVNIFGDEYVIRAEESAEYIKQVAKCVNQEIEEVTEKGARLSRVKMMVLVAMNLADRYYKTQEHEQEIKNKILDKEEELEKLTEQYKELTKEYNNLQKEHNSLKTKYKKLQQRYDDLDKKHKKLRGERNKFEKKYNNLQQKYKELDNEYQKFLMEFDRED
ncbi:cell division protein ZapA [Sporohalobacter salinus]|uniref:cell division protein ZapA n=1 Tax=Sporohalobacter salinus TaxID=1494606 RepID=UPI001960F190|nr:cell division protein ZapA [Sporohalobacter salinus]MBM7624641.1 cell division protein ZapA [Sporohalobacter salinus]